MGGAGQRGGRGDDDDDDDEDDERVYAPQSKRVQRDYLSGISGGGREGRDNSPKPGGTVSSGPSRSLFQLR